MSARSDIEQGYASARRVTKHHAKSFYFASVILFGARRQAAFALYAFCRRLDDLVDEAGPENLQTRLALARQWVRSVYRDLDVSNDTLEGLPRVELLALRDAVGRFHIPEQPFLDLIDGLEMDLTLQRYETESTLDLYCYRVAGTVGLLMTPVLGYSDDAALGPAVDLGKAMQLTNILRDVGEDLERGRIYLPKESLAAFGLSHADIEGRVVDERFCEFMRAQIHKARTLYAQGAEGIAALEGFGSQRTVLLMGTLYGKILDAIEAQNFDVYRHRAQVPFRKKLVLAAGVLVQPRRTRVRALPRGAEPRLLSQGRLHG